MTPFPSTLACSTVFLALLGALPLEAQEIDYVDWVVIKENEVEGVLPDGVVVIWGGAGTTALLENVVIDGTSTAFGSSSFPLNPFVPPVESTDQVGADFGRTDTVAILFSSPVRDPIVHLTNVQGTYEFSTPIEIVSGSTYDPFSNPPYQSVGSIALSADGMRVSRSASSSGRLDMIAGTFRLGGEQTSVTVTCVDCIDSDSVVFQWGVPGPEDADADGIADAFDRCPGTTVPEGVPTRRLGVRRWALVDADREFDTTPPPGGTGGPGRTFSLSDTGGCSCEQIISALGLGAGHEKYGCSGGVMEAWVDG